MLDGKKYNRQEIDHGKDAVKQQLTAYQKLIDAGNAPLGEFKSVFFNSMTLVLARYFIIRQMGNSVIKKQRQSKALF
ncbi:hypothetical protein AB4Z50_33980 [Paenibacillus sp. 2TAB26]|uniref:hypothetical protein n=1 Tax=Paenibacillus sp. 2TAB26 TaxID=3233005 RepID=UPI003F990C99